MKYENTNTNDVWIMCCDIILRVVLNNCYNLLSMQRCWCILIQKAVILSSLSIIFKTNLVSFTPVVARACDTINFRSGCTVQTIDGVDVEVCYCDRALCNDSTHVTSPTVACVFALVTIGVINMLLTNSFVSVSAGNVVHMPIRVCL